MAAQIYLWLVQIISFKTSDAFEQGQWSGLTLHWLLESKTYLEERNVSTIIHQLSFERWSQSNFATTIVLDSVEIVLAAIVWPAEELQELGLAYYLARIVCCLKSDHWK